MRNWLRIACEEVGVDYNGFKRRITQLPQKRNISFRSIHYLYILAMTIVGSVTIYWGGQIPYIDALFFASGSATQSGLNTVDVNLLLTIQQVAIYTITFFCTPIYINSCVVLFRLYTFQRRFEDIAKEARADRQSRSRSLGQTFSRSRGRQSVDLEDGPRGVNGRSITVLRDSGRRVENVEGFELQKAPMATVPETDSSVSSRAEKADQSDDMNNRETNPQSTRSIRFPDEIPSPSNVHDRHLAFLERQRAVASTRPLRIPGPREADEGAVPEEVEGQQDTEDQDEEPSRPHGILKARTESQSLSIRPNVTIEEPPRPLHSSPSEGRAAHRRVPSNPYALRPPNLYTPSEAPTVKSRRSSISSLRRRNSQEANQGTVSYLSWQPTVGRNSLFFALTPQQRDELGGIEYRSLKTLAWTLLGYYVLFHIIPVIILVPWILKSDQYGQIIDSVGQNRVWWAIFSSATLFNDLGFTLTPNSFISFQDSVLVLIIGTYLIVIGNTGFPCMLRLIIWCMSRMCPNDSPLYEELRFLLDHPRRCFTLLFPAEANWVLFGVLVLLNGIDLLFFVILDLNNTPVTQLPGAFKFLDGLFQAVSTRTAGTACVNIAQLHPGIQVSYLIMMYISVFPIAISVRRTNVYEEKSLGIYTAQNDEEQEGNPNYVGTHLRKQLSFDLWYIFIGLFIIAIAEGTRISDPNEPSFTIFAILFEIVSAYGTVGLSLGYDNINASFSAEFTTVSKLVIVAMQIRGRHRGLPYDLDRAINLPSEKLHRQEQEEGERLALRRAASMSLDRRISNESITREGTENAYATSAVQASGHEMDRNQSGAESEGTNPRGRGYRRRLSERSKRLLSTFASPKPQDS